MSKKVINLDNKQGDNIMQKVSIDNEKIKRKYYEYLEQFYSEATINSIKKSIYRYEEFTNFESFAKFNKKRAMDFKKWLEEKPDAKTKKERSLTTVYNYLRSLKDFFKWLSSQAGYKSKLCITDIDYLNLTKEKKKIALGKTREHYPTMEQVKTVIESIEINNELDLRDRALLSFTLLSGMRDSAIITLPIGAFDEEKLQINQDPKKGVKTKFSKTIRSYIFKFDEQLLNYFLEWYSYLKSEKLFSNDDPIFPKNKVENSQENKSFLSNSVEPKFWQSVSSMRALFKQRFQDAGIEYFSPHTFRHLAVLTAISRCRNGNEIKAVSQNFGHENVGTTMQTYGTLNQATMSETIKNMNFSDSNDNNQAELIAQFQAFIKQQGQGNF